MSYKKQIIDIVVNFVLSKIWARLKKKDKGKPGKESMTPPTNAV